MKRVTIRDVAALAGVSPSTASRVLNDHPAISEKTRIAVQNACQELQYVPDMTARGLAGHMTYTLGVIVPDISNPYFSAICTSIERYAAEKGYRVLLTNTLHDPARELNAVDRMLSQQVDGMIISSCAPQSQEEHVPLLGDLPCIYVGNNHGPACSYVEVDNERGSYEATQYLYHLGHRKIIFLGGRTVSRTLEQRLNGYRRSMLLNGLTPEGLITPADARSMRQWCYEQAKKLFSNSFLPDAIIAYSDIMAMEVLAAAKEFHLQVPEQISVIGFDNASFSHLPQIQLTTVSQRKARIGYLAVERLLEKIRGDNRQTTDILQPELMIRSTCRRIDRY